MIEKNQWQIVSNECWDTTLHKTEYLVQVLTKWIRGRRKNIPIQHM